MAKFSESTWVPVSLVGVLLLTAFACGSFYNQVLAGQVKQAALEEVVRNVDKRLTRIEVKLGVHND